MELVGKKEVEVCGCSHAKNRPEVPFCDGTCKKLVEIKETEAPLTPRTKANATKKYLKTILPDLTDGLTQLSLTRPEDPFGFLGRYILSKSGDSQVRSLASSLGVETKVTQGPLKVVVVGTPCAGKGTVSVAIAKEFKLVHISVKQVLKEAVKNKTTLGLTAFNYMKKAEIIPDDLLVSIVNARLNKPDCQGSGWLLEAFPNSPGQARALVEANIQPDIFLSLDIPDDAASARVVGRRVDPQTNLVYHKKFDPPPSSIAKRVIQQPEDKHLNFKNRLAIYRKHESAIASNFAYIIHRVNANREKEVLRHEIFAKLKDIIAMKAKR